VDHHTQSRPSFEGRGEAVVAKEDAGKLAVLVLQGEIAMAGRRDRYPPYLALDPDVAQSAIGAHGVPDGARDFAYAEDPQGESGL
jgi:hypothetical protein